MDKEFSAKYLDHIVSPEWRELKEGILAVRGNKCQICGETTGFLDLHHLTYERLGNEHYYDVLLVCRECHGIIEKEKDFRRRAREIIATQEQILDIQSSIFTREMEAEAVYLANHPDGESDDRLQELEWLHDQARAEVERKEAPLEQRVRELKWPNQF